MNLKYFNTGTWSEILKSEKLCDGYLGTFISHTDKQHVDLLIFIDENDKKHFVIEVKDTIFRDIKDPNINGIRLSSKQFKFNGTEVKKFIDIECSMDEYLEEFTEVIKEISTEILIHNKEPFSSVMDVIENWRAFLASRIKEILSDEEQIGLLCELIILKKLCDINPSMALSSWRGPLGEKHDFVFSDWSFEIKGTRSGNHRHLINGIDQLKKPENKDLAFISFLITLTQTQKSISIQSLIIEIVAGPLKNKGPLIELFHKLLVAAGYSRIFAEEYKKIQFEIITCTLFNVDEYFPKITSDNLSSPLNNRVSEIRYKIDLEGLNGQNINTVQLGNYFY